jgi:4'-phosphopantetheinyl transferase
LEILWTRPATPPPLEPTQIHVWAIALGETSSDDSFLSPDELQRAHRFHFARHKHRYTRARTALRQILAHYLQIDPRAIEFSYGANGKPFLAGNPLYFNLSHSDNLALAAVTHAAPVGVDVEKIRLMGDVDDIAHRFFSPLECALLKKLPQPEKSDAFFTLWTRKEALIKVEGRGLTEEMIRLDSTTDSEKSAGALKSGQRQVSMEEWFLFQLQSAATFKSALATESPKMDVVCGVWDFREGEGGVI